MTLTFSRLFDHLRETNASKGGNIVLEQKKEEKKEFLYHTSQDLLSCRIQRFAVLTLL